MFQIPIRHTFVEVSRRLSHPGQRPAPEDNPRGRSHGQQDGRPLPQNPFPIAVGPRVDHLERSVRGDLEAVLELPSGPGLVVGHGNLASGAGGTGADGERGAGVVFGIEAALWKESSLLLWGKRINTNTTYILPPRSPEVPST